VTDSKPRAAVVEARSLDRRALNAFQPRARFGLHSVFERAINLTDASGGMLTLVVGNGGNGPGTVVLETPGLQGLTSVLGSDPIVTVDEQDGLTLGRQLVIDFSKAAVWQPPPLGGLNDPQTLRTNVARSTTMAHRSLPGEGLEGLLAQVNRLLADPVAPPPTILTPVVCAAWRALSELLPAWRANNGRAVAAAASRLVGLGPGQTPSGDDVLAGFVVAQRRFQCLARRNGFPIRGLLVDLDKLGAACLEAAHGLTTDLGFARLRYAVQGDLDERSELVIAALLTDQAPRVEAATRELLAFGHSSGVDTLLGIVLAIECCVTDVGMGR
jgi:hypothetical protein